MKKIPEGIPVPVQEKYGLFSNNDAFEILKALHPREFEKVMNALWLCQEFCVNSFFSC